MLPQIYKTYKIRLFLIGNLKKLIEILFPGTLYLVEKKYLFAH